MNKGFFVVFLGIVVGAMALIFFNQASTPSIMPANPGTVAEAPASPRSGWPQPPQPEPAKPEPATHEPAKPEPATPASVTPEPAKPEPVKAASVTPEPAKPEPVKAELVKPEPAKSEPAKSVIPEPVKKSLALKDIGLHFKGKGVVLRIEADGGFSYKTFVLPSPDRYVVDLGGSWSGMRMPTIPANNMVKSARVGNQAGGPRVVLDLQRPLQKHRVTWVAPTVLEIYLE